MLLLGASALLALGLAGIAVERRAGTQLVRVGQVAPDFTLPSTAGGTRSLTAERGRPVLLVFVPAVRCGQCTMQLRAVQEALPALQTGGTTVFGLSVDSNTLQRGVVDDLRLQYPLLTEAPTYGQHPVGTAYGLYHTDTSPVDSTAVVAIDATGVVRAVMVRGDGVIAVGEIVAAAMAARGGAG